MSRALQGDKAAGLRDRRVRLHLQHLQRSHPQVNRGLTNVKWNQHGTQSCLLPVIFDFKCCVHSGIITNTGGKVIVRKMAGQNIYKGSNSNGVRSLSLPKWRESFVVSGISDEVNDVKHTWL